MIGQNRVKTIVGWMILIGHVLIVMFIFIGKDAEWDIERKMSAALTITPVSAAYFVAVVKGFIGSGTETGRGRPVNLNYAGVSIFVPACLLLGIFYVVYSFPSQSFAKPEQMQQVLAGLETLLGGVVGFVVDSLFPNRAAE